METPFRITPRRVLGAKSRKPSDLRRERERLPPRPHDQHRGRIGRPGQMRGRGRVRRARNAVVKPHHALDDASAVRRDVPRELAAHRGLVHKEQVEVAARDAEHRGVEHGVDIIRPAFERRKRRAAALKRAQQRARHGRFAAARAGACEQQAGRVTHASRPPPDRMNTGLFAVIMV